MGTSGEPVDEVRGAWVAETDGRSDCLTGWPKGIRLIVREERPHPAAQLRCTDADRLELTCFATSTTGQKIAELEPRHRSSRSPSTTRLAAPARPYPHRPAAGAPPPARLRLFSGAAQLVTTVGGLLFRSALSMPDSYGPGLLRVVTDGVDGPPP